ncbi:hypothetical protein JRC04_17720 [Mycolicibacterium sp. S2-37]|uniref:hypothetical protein n=1 Tax=Mycolicibacterium sp. S2-37 TaxID=2810297 RepID=UPI001A946AB0|nr:hypothetical protein [Mycolicibacterium sp. S2-37]MBO0679307.1 hypothetical protein [Mycolicibacterium sp. S2-37]
MQCGAEWSVADIRATAPREVSLSQLVAVHVMSMDDDGLRHFVPRLLEVMQHTPEPVFDFRLADLKDRLPAWRPEESAAVLSWAGAVWAALLADYPADLGYFSDVVSALDLLDWCGLPLARSLDELCAADGVGPARHLADVVDAVLTVTAPFESASKATALAWVSAQAVGDRLQDGFFAAGSDDVAAQHLSSAHELWTVCGRRP